MLLNELVMVLRTIYYTFNPDVYEKLFINVQGDSLRVTRYHILGTNSRRSLGKKLF